MVLVQPGQSATIPFVRKTFWGQLLLFLSCVITTAAWLFPVVARPAVVKLPGSIHAQLNTTPFAGVVLDAAAFAAGTVLTEHAADPTCAAPAAEGSLPSWCFVAHNVPVQAFRQVNATAAGSNELLLQSNDLVRRTDREASGATITATRDQVTIDRHTALATSAPTWFSLTASDTPAPFTRSGYQYQFPFPTAQHSYPYWDNWAQQTNPIEFQGTATVAGVTAYRFHQTVGPIDMFPVAVKRLGQSGTASDTAALLLQSMQLKGLARNWYQPQELAALGLDSNATVTLHRYYQVVRNLWVEPTSGMIVDGQEIMLSTFARTPAEAAELAAPFFAAGGKDFTPNPARTALYADLHWDAATQQARSQEAAAFARQIVLLDRAVLAGKILGPWLFISVCLTGFWRRRRPQDA